MPSKPETKVRRKLVSALRRIPGSVWYSIQQLVIRGNPDIFGCVRGKFVAIEVKERHDSPAQPLQLHKLRCIQEAGGVAMIVHGGNIAERVKEIEEL